MITRWISGLARRMRWWRGPGSEFWNFLPDTIILPDDMEKWAIIKPGLWFVVSAWQAKPGLIILDFCVLASSSVSVFWIIKPSNMNRGMGIR